MKNERRLISVFFICVLQGPLTMGFVAFHGQSSQRVLRRMSKLSLTCTDELLRFIDRSSNERDIKDKISEMERTFRFNATDSDLSRFDRLVGLYDVAYTAVAKEGDNPVGGKWTRPKGRFQRLFQTKRAMQHILHFNTTGLCRNVSVAEAVNVIVLEALSSRFRVTVILRGDAVPLEAEQRAANPIALSNLAVQALFDPPRIVFGKSGRVNVNVGPRSSVVLDTTYVDDAIRIGMGGRTGTRFVFRRCNDTEASDFQQLLARSPLRKSKVIAVLASFGIAGMGAVRVGPFLLKYLGVVSTLLSLISIGLVASTTGGIERNDMSVKAAEEFDASINERFVQSLDERA